MLPAQICFYEGSILSAVQYAKNRFIIPSLAPILYNIGIILGGVLLSSRIGITGFAVGVLGGAICGNFLLQIYGAWRAGANFRPNFNVRHPGFWMFLKLSVPIMLALSLSFVDDWIIRWFGSYLQPASITWLTDGKTLMRVPLGLVGQAIGVASFPDPRAALFRKKIRRPESHPQLHVPRADLLASPYLRAHHRPKRPLVYLVFLRTPVSAARISPPPPPRWFSFLIGMFAWGAQNILARGFYATRDTITPAVVGTLTTLLSLPVYWLLVRRMDYSGLALASTIGIVAYTILLFVLLGRRTKNPEEGSIVIFFLKVAAASCITAYACNRLAAWLENFIPWQHIPGALLLLTLVTSVGIVLFVALLKVFRVPEVTQYLRRAYSFANRV